MKLLSLTLSAFLLLTTLVFAEFKQDPLPYAYNALEPYIDAQTMEIHYSKHHAGYIQKLNAAITSQGINNDITYDELFSNMNKYNNAVRNNAGGSYNHNLFWKLLTPEKNTKPSTDLIKDIEKTFGSFDAFKEQFSNSALSVFGSGWAWLIVNKDNKLQIITTPNQDNPLMNDVAVRGIPILTIDVWEHAYYLKYQNRRADYIGSFWNIINWETVNNLYSKSK
ncbi:MAG: superoxide dismutase [Ignavibacteria bacterium GWF2_33_9]|nr:MAG: superoxide dismutase [Ignavibacteria bacterium GWF2_33_9]